MKVAGFAALPAVVLSVLAQADIVLAHAEGAVLVTQAFLLFQFTNRAKETVRHVPNCSPNAVSALVTARRTSHASSQ